MTASVFNVITVNPNYPASQVVTATRPPQSVLLYNADPANTIWLADANSFQPGDPNHGTPLPPLSSVTFDGTSDVYASTVPGQTANLQMYPSGSSYFAVQGVEPLAQIGTAGITPAGTLVPGIGFNILSLVPVAQFASYDLNTYVQALNPGAVDSVLTAQIELQWFDDLVSGVAVFEEDWDIWAGRAAPVAGSGVNTLAGCGPMHGKYMTVNIFIPGGATSNATLWYFNIFGSNRTVPYSDWRQAAGLVNPQNSGMTIIPSINLAFDNTLAGANNQVVPASSIFWQPCGLYSGPAYLRFQSSAAPNVAILANSQYLLSSQLIAALTCPGILKNIGTGTTEVTQQLNLPRGPCAILIATGAASDTVSFQLIAQQAA
jgi:hypothetical protein